MLDYSPVQARSSEILGKLANFGLHKKEINFIHAEYVECNINLTFTGKLQPLNWT